MAATDVPPASGRGRWRVSPAASVARTRRVWLAAGGALTLHLAHVAGRHDALEQAGTSAYPVTVRVIKERREKPWTDEAPLLGRAARSVVWVREVELSIDGTPCVLAHSVTGLTDSRGRWRAMRTLRTRPLAVLLYKDPSVRRSSLTSRMVGGVCDSRSRRSSDPLARLYARHAASLPALDETGEFGDDRRDAMPSRANATIRFNSGTSRRLLARRSVFERNGAPLIITECFLPAFWQLLDRGDAR
jgi:chorismate--pyruvate lyase